MILERKVAINQYGSRHSLEGFILFRVASKLPMTAQVARDTVVNHIRGEIQAAHAAGNFNDMKLKVYNQDMDTLSNLPIVYVKEKTFSHPEGDIYYTQLLLDLGSISQSCVSPTSYSMLPELASGMLGAIYNGYGMRVTPRCPLPDFTYEVSNIKFGGRVVAIRSAEGNTFNQYVYDHVNTPQNNIAVAQELNTTKSYNKNSILRLHYHIYEDIVEALNDKKTSTLNVSIYDNIYGTLVFGNLEEQHGGIYRIRIMYKGKFYAFWQGKMLVCYDGNKSLECVKPYLEEWSNGGIRQLDVLQFCSNRDFFFQEDMNNEFSHINKTILHFLNRDKLFLSRSGITYRNGSLSGQIYYQPAKGKKMSPINMAIKPFNQNYFTELVIPVGDKNEHITALSRVADLLKAKMNPGIDIDVNLAFAEYKATMFETIDAQDDVLAKWFSYCTKSSKTTDDGIIRAYVKMKANLEKEYKEIGSYLNCYDFSKCSAVPKLEMDKKLRENCYKSLHVEPKNVIIKSINNKKINPINETRPTVKFMVTANGICAIGEMPLNKYYDAKSNSIILNYNKMKGEVVRDKIKNRR